MTFRLISQAILTSRWDLETIQHLLDLGRLCWGRGILADSEMAVTQRSEASLSTLELNYTATLSCPVLHSFLHSLQLLDVVGVVLTLIGKHIHFLWPSKAPKRFVLNLGSSSRLDYLVDHQ